MAKENVWPYTHLGLRSKSIIIIIIIIIIIKKERKKEKKTLMLKLKEFDTQLRILVQ